MDGTMDCNGKEEEEEKEDIRCWKYINEGNESLVIGHKKKNIVYKMWKQDAKDVPEKNSRKSECWKKINYFKNNIQPVLGKYARIPKCISVSSHFVDSVSKAFESQRPLKRRHKVVDPYQESVLCSPNFCFLDDVGKKGIPTLTVELKPKPYNIPTHQQPPPANHQPVCRFCTGQALKRKKGDWDYTSEYCPVNLFSGDPDRMRYALEGLFKTPHNNLYIFKDGDVIYPRESKSLPTEKDVEDITMAIQTWFGSKEDSSLSSHNTHLPPTFTNSVCIQDLISLVIQALCTSDNTSTFQEISEGSSPWVPCHEGQCHALNDKHELNESKLPKGCVLERILTMKRMNTHGIEVIAKVYQRYMDHLTQYPEQKEELGFTEQCMSSSPPTTSLNMSLSNDDISRLPIQDCVTLLKTYMMSRIPGDCSVLVTFKPADLSSTMDNAIVSLKEERFHFACRLVDLDSQKLSKIPFWLKQKQLISETYHKR